MGAAPRGQFGVSTVKHVLGSGSYIPVLRTRRQASASASGDVAAWRRLWNGISRRLFGSRDARRVQCVKLAHDAAMTDAAAGEPRDHCLARAAVSFRDLRQRAAFDDQRVEGSDFDWSKAATAAHPIEQVTPAPMLIRVIVFVRGWVEVVRCVLWRVEGRRYVDARTNTPSLWLTLWRELAAWHPSAIHLPAPVDSRPPLV